jgi:hypothetical protein
MEGAIVNPKKMFDSNAKLLANPEFSMTKPVIPNWKMPPNGVLIVCA